MLKTPTMNLIVIHYLKKGMPGCITEGMPVMKNLKMPQVYSQHRCPWDPRSKRHLKPPSDSASSPVTFSCKNIHFLCTAICYSAIANGGSFFEGGSFFRPPARRTDGQAATLTYESNAVALSEKVQTDRRGTRTSEQGFFPG